MKSPGSLGRKSVQEKKMFPWKNLALVKFIYSEKATRFCDISTVDLSSVVPVKSTVEILQNFVTFSEYMNFFKMFTLNSQTFFVNDNLIQDWTCNIGHFDLFENNFFNFKGINWPQSRIEMQIEMNYDILTFESEMNNLLVQKSIALFLSFLVWSKIILTYQTGKFIFEE